MRATLNALYLVAAWVAAAMMVGVLVMVTIGILGRQLDFYVPGTDAYAGYLMAGAGFMALAHTFKCGEHIRVTLFIQALGRSGKSAVELWSLAVAVFLGAVIAFYSVRLAWQSHAFHDISTGNDATPLWIPQLGMAVGTVILLIALIDELVLEVTGRRVEPTPAAEPSRSE